MVLAPRSPPKLYWMDLVRLECLFGLGLSLECLFLLLSVLLNLPSVYLLSKLLPMAISFYRHLQCTNKFPSLPATVKMPTWVKGSNPADAPYCAGFGTRLLWMTSWKRSLRIGPFFGTSAFQSEQNCNIWATTRLTPFCTRAPQPGEALHKYLGYL
jgi:hypothetical protein